MNMFISYLNRKNFLGFDINCNMYFQIPFLVFYMPFISHPLTSVSNLNASTINCNDNIFVCEFHVIIDIFYLYIQTIYSSVYCCKIWYRRYFPFGMTLCDTFGLPIW